LAALEPDRIHHAPKRTEVEFPEAIKLDAMAGLVMI
jgi:hypothetical protein